MLQRERRREVEGGKEEGSGDRGGGSGLPPPLGQRSLGPSLFPPSKLGPRTSLALPLSLRILRVSSSSEPATFLPRSAKKWEPHLLCSWEARREGEAGQGCIWRDVPASVGGEREVVQRSLRRGPPLQRPLSTPCPHGVHPYPPPYPLPYPLLLQGPYRASVFLPSLTAPSCFRYTPVEAPPKPTRLLPQAPWIHPPHPRLSFPDSLLPP